MPNVDHYRALLKQQQWLDVSSLCWSVVRTPGGHHDVARRLAPGTDLEVRELDPREDPLNLSPLLLIFVDGQGSVVSLIQTNGGDYLQRQDMLARLSHDGLAWSVSWGPPVNVRLANAVRGSSSYEWRTFDDADGDPAGPFGESLAAVVEAERQDDWAGVRAAAMAAVDAASGASLDAAWFDDSQRAFVVDYPDQAPGPLLPPFARTDPARTAFLRALPGEVRREVLLTMAETMRDRFDLDALPGVTGRLRRGGGLSDAEGEALVLLLEDVCGDWQESGERERLHAGLAFRAALRAAGGEAANFDALASARAALGAQWQELDTTIQRLTNP